MLSSSTGELARLCALRRVIWSRVWLLLRIWGATPFWVRVTCMLSGGILRGRAGATNQPSFQPVLHTTLVSMKQLKPFKLGTCARQVCFCSTLPAKLLSTVTAPRLGFSVPHVDAHSPPRPPNPPVADRQTRIIMLSLMSGVSGAILEYARLPTCHHTCNHVASFCPPDDARASFCHDRDRDCLTPRVGIYHCC